MIQSIIAIPLLFKNTLVGVLIFGSSKRVDLLKQYLNLFRQLETFIGSEINRKSLEVNLTNLFQAIPDIICIADLTERFLKINKVGCDLLEHSRAGKTNENFEKIDLNNLLSDYKLLRSKIISEKNATIYSAELPVLFACKVPLMQTMHCLR